MYHSGNRFCTGNRWRDSFHVGTDYRTQPDALDSRQEALLALDSCLSPLPCRLPVYDHRDAQRLGGTLCWYLPGSALLWLGTKYLPRTAQHDFRRALPQLCQPAQRTSCCNMYAHPHDSQRHPCFLLRLSPILPSKHAHRSHLLDCHLGAAIGL